MEHTSEQPSFPCDNFICLLQKFELLKTDRGFLVKRSKSKSHEDCVHFKCWLNKYKLTKTSYGFELIDLDLQNQPLFTNNKPQEVFVSQTQSLEGIRKRVIFSTNPTPTIENELQSEPSESTTTTTIMPESTDESYDDFFYDYFDYE